MGINIKQNKIMSDEDNEFIKGENAGSAVGVVEAGRAKPGTLVMMKETFPCKVTAMNTAKPGKHGSAKAMIVAKDIFTVSHLSDIVKLIKKIHTTGKKECLVTVQHFDNREQV